MISRLDSNFNLRDSWFRKSPEDMKVSKAEMVTLKDEILDSFGGSLFPKVLE